MGTSIIEQYAKRITDTNEKLDVDVFAITKVSRTSEMESGFKIVGISLKLERK
jgi:hypothetical protein